MPAAGAGEIQSCDWMRRHWFDQCCSSYAEAKNAAADDRRYHARCWPAPARNSLLSC